MPRRKAYDLRPKRKAPAAAPTAAPTAAKASEAKASTPRRPQARAKEPKAPVFEAEEQVEDQVRRLQKLLRLSKKQILTELRLLSEKQLREFKIFLESERVEEVRNSTCRPKLAIRDRRAKLVTQPKKKPDTGVCFNNAHRHYCSSIAFLNLQLKSRCVKSLEVAIDFHLSLVQIKQQVLTGLAEGAPFQDLCRTACASVEAERTAAGALPMNLRFRCTFARSRRLTHQDLDKALAEWSAMRQLREEHLKKKQEAKLRWKDEQDRKANAQEERVQKRQLRAEEEARRRKAIFNRRLRRVQSIVTKQLLKVEKLRRQEEKEREQRERRLKEQQRRLLKPFGVVELPSGLQLTSFQAPNDTICAMLPLDGSLQPGPFRRTVGEALRDLKEMRALAGEELRHEMQRRELDAMTAFFVEGLQKSWATMSLGGTLEPFNTQLVWQTCQVVIVGCCS